MARHMRTGTEGTCRGQTSTPIITQIDHNEQHETPNQQPPTLMINVFKLQPYETKATQELEL